MSEQISLADLGRRDRDGFVAAILATFPLRLANTREQEIAAALGEIAKIAWLRLHDRVAPGAPVS